MIESSARVRALPGYPLAEIPSIRRRLMVLGGASFGPAGGGYFRIALIAGSERLREAVTRLGPALTRVREEQLATAT